MLDTIKSGSQRSEALTLSSQALIELVVVSRSVHGSVRFAGAAMIGGVSSGVTVMVLVVVEELPQASTAVQVTVVIPPPSQMSMAVGV